MSRFSDSSHVCFALTILHSRTAGDLDPETSKYTLVPLKVAYKKLRLLVDLGCIFIGHGLKKDFRIINIHVPEAQVIDTVDLYHSAAHPRKLSLRFLSWFLLKQDIQTGSALEGHDSIEDAHAALRLYRLYEGFEKDGRLDDVMEDLYEEGRRVVSCASAKLTRCAQADRPFARRTGGLPRQPLPQPWTLKQQRLLLKQLGLALALRLSHCFRRERLSIMYHC